MCFRIEELMAITLNKFLIQGFLGLNRTAMKICFYNIHRFCSVLNAAYFTKTIVDWIPATTAVIHTSLILAHESTGKKDL